MSKNELAEYFVSKENFTFDDLCKLMTVLRGEGGCPWDREQTHESIRRDLIEETYEVIEAIDTKDPVLMCEELGDLMMQVTFHTEIERELGRFNINDVIDGICKKLILRHPHVFGDIKLCDSAEVLTNWDKIKNNEKQRNTITSRLRSVSPSLPALLKADKVGKRAKAFDFSDAEEAFSKISEETAEIREAMLSENSKEKLHEEIGDLLFSVANFARKCGVDPEQSLNDATEKFISRFELVENEIIKSGKNVESVSQNELDAIWTRIKSQKYSK